MHSFIGVLAPFGGLLLFLYRAFVPAEVNVSVLLEDHAMDLGACAVCMAWMSVNLFRAAPKSSLPEPEPAKPEPTPEPSPEPTPDPEPSQPEPEPTPDQPVEPDPAPEAPKQVRQFKV